jgi:hypothetical protein
VLSGRSYGSRGSSEFLAIAATAVLLLLADPRAFYLPDAAIAAGFVLIIWNGWVLLTEVAERSDVQGNVRP